MKMWRPVQLRRGMHACTARRLVPEFDPLGLDIDVHLIEIRLRLFRRNYPRADTRLRTRQTLWEKR